MIGKKEYTNTIELQLLKKEKASLESKVFKYQREQESLKEKLKESEVEKDSLKKLIDSAESGSVSKLKISDVLLRSNIRDEYEFEEIEDLALDILINGQLQPVLVTKDNYLISGHRRYFALTLINSNPESIKIPDVIKNKDLVYPDFLVTYHIDRHNHEIEDLELQDIQYAENNERRALDNFQLSKLYNSYLEKGLEQKDLVTKFKKTKGNISSVVALKKIDSQLVRWLKEFQVFAWSKERFSEELSKQLTEIQEQFYLNNKGIIGWKPLYNIAKQNSLTEQKRIFLELYGTRLSKNELESFYFDDLKGNNQTSKESFKEVYASTLKQFNNFSTSIDKILSMKIDKTKAEKLKEAVDTLKSILKDI